MDLQSPKLHSKIAIIATPRSGSTWFYGMLSEYLRRQNPEALNLEEYFNVEQLRGIFLPVDGKSFVPSKMTIFPLQPWDPPPISGYQLTYKWGQRGVEKVFEPYTQEKILETQELLRTGRWREKLKLESEKRLEWLEKETRSHVIVKIMAEDFEHNPKLAEFLEENYQILFLKRDCLIDQVESFCLGMASGVWHSKELALERIGNKPFPCRKEWLDQIVHYLSSYSKLRKKIKGREVSYEDLCSWKTPERIIENIFLKEGSDSSRTQSSREFKYFTNSNEVSTWMKGNKVALITSSNGDSSQFYESLLEDLREKDPKVLSLGEFFNVQKLRFPVQGNQLSYQWGPQGIECVQKPFTDEVSKQIQMIAQLGAWAEFRFLESQKRLNWLREDPRESVLVQVNIKDFEDNPELAAYLSSHFKIFYLDEKNLSDSFSNVRKKLRTPFIHLANSEIANYPDNR